MSDTASDALARYLAPNASYRLLFTEVQQAYGSSVEWQCNLCTGFSAIGESQDGVASKFKSHLDHKHTPARAAAKQPSLENDDAPQEPAVTGAEAYSGSSRFEPSSNKSKKDRNPSRVLNEDPREDDELSETSGLSFRSSGDSEADEDDVAAEGSSEGSSSTGDGNNMISLRSDPGAPLPKPTASSSNPSSSFSIRSDEKNRLTEYECRRQTFQDRTSDDTKKMAFAGFYLADGCSLIRCFVCGTELRMNGLDLKSINTKLCHHDGCPRIGTRLDSIPEFHGAQVTSSDSETL